MNHPAELAVHQYMESAVKGDTSMSEDTIKQVASEVAEALTKQFGGGNKRDDFRLRMSNIGRPTCQLWYDKNKPEIGLPKPTTFIMNMMIGDIVEAVFKGLLKEARVKYEEPEHVTLELPNAKINGTYDIVIDGAVDDVKSASNWSYTNKFESYDTLASGDSFGYVAQLAGYAKAADKKVGGWWVVNKATGDFKYVRATMDLEEELAKIEKTVDTVNKNEFKRCFEPEKETFRGKETGNTVLNKNCTFCSYRFDCFNITEKPAVMSQAKMPKITPYIELADEYKDAV